MTQLHVDEVDETFSAGLSVDGWEYVPGGSYSHINDFIFQAEATATGPGLNTAFFENTIEIGNFKFYDENGNQIYGTLTSELGFEYSMAAPAAVPEPSLLVLLAGGALELVWRALRRRSQPAF